MPVIFGVLTTMAAFLPLVLSPGEMGQVFGAIGIVAIACLFFSLLESQLVLPAHLGHLGPRAKDSKQRDGVVRGFLRSSGVRQRWERIQAFTAGSLERLAQQRYRPLLEQALEWRYSTLAGGVVLLMLTLALAGQRPHALHASSRPSRATTSPPA